jgi:hypothetical protein
LTDATAWVTCFTTANHAPHGAYQLKVSRVRFQSKNGHEEAQIIGFLHQAEGGMAVKELCRLGGFSDATIYK